MSKQDTYGNSGDTTHPAGTRIANELGLYDMSGNVSELVWDGYGTYPTGILTDYRGAASVMIRVNRGGDWDYSANHCSVAYRGNIPSGLQSASIGFRVVRP